MLNFGTTRLAMEEFIDRFNHDFVDKYLFHLILVVFIVLGTIVVTRLLRIIIDRYFRRTSISSKIDPTRYAFAKNAVSASIYLIGIITIFYIIPPLRSLGLTLFAGAGIFAAIIGFASQAAFSNIVSGLFIVAFKPFRVEDIVTIGNLYSGVVEDITLRHTVIRNFENRRVVIPNSIISNEVILNSSLIEEKVCIHLEVGISYDSNVDLALKILQQEAENHPDCIDNRTPEDLANKEDKVKVRMINWADSSVTLRAWVWSVDPPTAFNMKCELLKSVKEHFEREGIEIPFPHRTLVFKNAIPHASQTEENIQA